MGPDRPPGHGPSGPRDPPGPRHRRRRHPAARLVLRGDPADGGDRPGPRDRLGQGPASSTSRRPASTPTRPSSSSRVMRKLRAEGRSIVFITHFLDQVYAVADRITVLRNGRLVGTYPTAALPRLDLIAKMLGRNLTELDDMTRIKLATKPDEAGEVRLVARPARTGRLDRAVRPRAASRRGRRAGRPARLGTDRDGVAALRRREARHRHARRSKARP